MSQNLITLNLSEEQLATATQGLSLVETALADMIAFSPEQRKGMKRMGKKSETFCRQTLDVLQQNPQIVPASVNLASAVADLKALDQLRPLLVRLRKLVERADHTELALGSDVMALALDGYSLLKVAGRSQGLESQLRELSVRFEKSRRADDAPPAS